MEWPSSSLWKPHHTLFQTYIGGVGVGDTNLSVSPLIPYTEPVRPMLMMGLPSRLCAHACSVPCHGKTTLKANLQLTIMQWGRLSVGFPFRTQALGHSRQLQHSMGTWRMGA